MNEYTFTKRLRDEESYRKSFNELAYKTFKITFEEWKNQGYWENQYIPYAFIDKGKVIANASVNTMSLICNGKRQKAVQIGTVMTDIVYRNQGLSRILIEKILKDYENECEFVYLFANNTVLNFYPKFGFKPVNEYQHSAWYKKQDTSNIIKKLNMGKQAEKDIFLRLISNHIPISKISIMDNLSLIMFYCGSFMSDNIFYIPDLDIAVVAEYEDDTLYLQDVFSSHEFELENIINILLNRDKIKVVLGFTPVLNNKFNCKLQDNSNDILFVKSSSDFNFEKCRFPVLSHA